MVLPDEPQVRFVDEARRAHGPLARFSPELPMREAPQLAVDDGDQPVERVTIPLAPGVEKPVTSPCETAATPSSFVIGAEF